MTVIRDLMRPVPREVWRSIMQRRGGSWNPAALFSGAQQGFWLDPSDLSTLFQDTAGTTPVTAPGQSIARINDKSGNANHFTQATSSSQPTLQQDGSGNYYISFDGLDDFLSSVTGPNFGGATTHSAAIRITADGAVHNVYDAATTRQLIGQTTGNVWRMFGGSTLSGASNDGLNHVLLGNFVGGASSLEVDKSSVASGAAGANTMSGTLRLGADSTGAAQFLIGRFYGGVITAYAMSTPDKAKLYTWLGAKAGLSL